MTKGNFVGQLTDVISLAVTSASPSVNEGATLQFGAQQILDDATLLPVPATSVAWSVAGPLSGITTSGLATAAPVYQNTLATVQGVVGSLFATRSVTVLNVNFDNFGAYAGDSLDDDWQVLYFGQPPNASAAPTADPDRDGQDNRLEFLSGFVPTDATSAFQFKITGFASPGVLNFRVNKVIPGRTYTLRESPNLTAPFTTVGTFSVSTQETDKLLQDPATPAGRNFYRLEISRP